MRTHRKHQLRALALPLTAVMLLSFSATGCGKIKELTGGEGEEEEASGTTGGAEKEEPKEEEKVEEKAELPPAAIAPPPPDPEPLPGLDGLLALMPAEGEAEMMLIRDPSVLIDYAKETGRFAEGPLERLAKASEQNPMLADMKDAQGASQMSKDMVAKVEQALKDANIDPKKGAIMVKTGGGHEFLAFGSDDPEAFKKVAAAMDEKPDGVCKAAEASPGYMLCADDQATLDGYKPAGSDGVKSVRDKLAASLPGTDIDDANIIMHFENNWGAISTHPGLFVMTMGAPKDDPEFKDVLMGVQPGAAKTLRSVQPGSGFVWVRLNPELAKAGAAQDPMGAELSKHFTGEVLFAGHHDPSTLALQFGFDDISAFEPVLAEAEKMKGEIEKELPAVGEGQWSYEVKDLPVGDATVRGLHVGLSGVPEADVLAHATGLTIDGYAFAANDTLTVAVGASPEAIGKVAGATGEGPNDDLKAYLPPSLTKSLDAGEVSMVVHVPVDSLQSPETRKLVSAALKNDPDFTPEMTTAALDLVSPLSSGTFWMTHAGEGAQFHFAVQGIGHTADEEGKAALDAAVAVTQGTDPAEAFGALADKYTDSVRLASYNARAGRSETALVASGLGAAVAGVAVLYPVFSEHRNPELAAELGVEEGEAEAAVEESKAPEQPKKPKKPKKPKPSGEKPKDPPPSDPPPSDPPPSDPPPSDPPADPGAGGEDPPPPVNKRPARPRPKPGGGVTATPK